MELWRTAPYLHDGSAGTVKDVVTVKNKADKHGRTTSYMEVVLRGTMKYKNGIVLWDGSRGGV